jgi:hypothetical protein
MASLVSDEQRRALVRMRAKKEGRLNGQVDLEREVRLKQQLHGELNLPGTGCAVGLADL